MILNIYKQKNWTSFDVVAKVRAELRHKRGTKKVRVGHAGTLDPLAEGVLLVLTDSDTKKQQDFMNLPKEYLAKIAFGATSPTYDLEGELTFITSLPDPALLQQNLTKVLPNYLGKQHQTVPPYSAVKINGKRLYREARQREITTSELPVKEIEIYAIEVKSFELEYVEPAKQKLPVLGCLIKCSSGTYIRSLAHNLGEDLKIGGVLIDLKRTAIGDHTVTNAIKMLEIPSLLA